MVLAAEFRLQDSSASRARPSSRSCTSDRQRPAQPGSITGCRRTPVTARPRRAQRLRLPAAERQLLSDANGDAGYTRADMEHLRLPRQIPRPGRGRRLAKVRLDAEQALDDSVTPPATPSASIRAASLKPAKRPEDAENIESIVVRCSHSSWRKAIGRGDGRGSRRRGLFRQLRGCSPATRRPRPAADAAAAASTARRRPS